MARWSSCHSADREFRGVIPLPSNHIDLPPPALQTQQFEVGAMEGAISASTTLESSKKVEA